MCWKKSAGAIGLGCWLLAGSPVSGKDAGAFLQSVIAEAKFEIALAELVKAKADDQRIRAFAERLATTQTAARDRAINLAAASNGPPAVAMQPSLTMLLERFEALEGATLEREFLQYMLEDQGRDLAQFTKVAKEGNAVGRFAYMQLPILQRQLGTAELLLKENAES